MGAGTETEIRGDRGPEVRLGTLSWRAGWGNQGVLPAWREVDGQKQIHRMGGVGGQTGRGIRRERSMECDTGLSIEDSRV